MRFGPVDELLLGVVLLVGLRVRRVHVQAVLGEIRLCEPVLLSRCSDWTGFHCWPNCLNLREVATAGVVEGCLSSWHRCFCLIPCSAGRLAAPVFRFPVGGASCCGG